MAKFDILTAYYDDPTGFVLDILDTTPNRDQMEALEMIRLFNRIAIKSGHGIGKTSLLAFIIIWFLCTRVDCRIPMTSPSQHQLLDILMPEISKWVSRSKVRGMVEVTATRISVKGYTKSWFGVARSCKKPENMQGFHAEDLMFIIEEASGVEQEIIEVIEGAITKPGNKLIMVGNPTKINGAFYDAFNKDRAIYKCLTYSSENSENVDKKYIERMLRYGYDSDVYRVRVRGLFPKGEPDTFITLDIVEDSISLEIDEDWDLVEFGVDPARFGDDESVVVHRKGLEVQPIEGFHGIDLIRLAGEVLRIARAYYAEGYVKPINIKVDETGVGGGVIDSLNNESRKEREKNQDQWEFCINVIPVINNGTASDPDYKEWGSQMWGNMKEALKTVKIPNDDNLVGQLTTRKYQVEADGKIKLERKKDMKKRKLPSPDRADALALCLMPMGGFNFDKDIEAGDRDNG